MQQTDDNLSKKLSLRAGSGQCTIGQSTVAWSCL